MDLKDKISVSCTGLDSEELYFKQQEEERMKALRESAEKTADAEYKSDHQYHCFRCGTASLVEVEHCGAKIDICLNEGCGAVHLDPGELDQIMSQGAGAIKKVQLAVLNIFK